MFEEKLKTYSLLVNRVIKANVLDTAKHICGQEWLLIYLHSPVFRIVSTEKVFA